MNGLKKNWKKLLVTIGVALAAFLAVPWVNHWVPSGNMSNGQIELVGSLVEFAIIFIAAVILRKRGLLKFRKEGLGTGMIVGIVPMAMTAFIIPVLIANVMKFGTVMTIPVSEFLFFTANVFMIGVCEEFLFRGIIQKSLHEFFGEDSQWKVRIAILIQAVLFGLIHLSNLYTAGASFKSNIIQVIGAMGLGAVLGAVYYRSNKNLWASILVHAIIDFRAFIFTGALTGSTIVQSLNSYSNKQVSPAAQIASITCVTLCLIGIAFFATRRKKIQNLLCAAN